MSKQSNSTPTASDLKRRIEELEGELEATGERLKTVDAELRAYLQCALLGKDEEIQSAKKDEEKLKEQNTSLQRENTDLRHEVDTLKQSLRSEEENMVKAQEDAISMKESNQTLKDLLASMETEHNSFKEAKAVAEVASNKEYEKWKEENVTLRTANADLFAQLQRGQRDIDSLEDSIQTLREANEKLDQSNQCLQKNYRSLLCAYEQIYGGHEALRSSYSQLFDQYSNLKREQMDVETLTRSIKTLGDANQKLDANNQSLEKNCKSLDDTLKAKEAEIQMMKDAAVSRDTFDDYRTNSLTLVRDLEKSLKLKEEKIQMMKKVAIDRDKEADAKRTHILNLVRDIKTYKEKNRMLEEKYKGNNRIPQDSLMSKEDSFKRELEESIASYKALQEKYTGLEGKCKQLECDIELGKQATEKSRAVVDALERNLKSKEETIEMVRQEVQAFQRFLHLSENDEPTSKKRRVS